MKNNIKIICVIIGTMIGAGFASGKEIFLFFGSYGFPFSLLGLFISTIFTSFIVYRVLFLSYHNSITHYSDFLENLLGKKHSILKNVINIIVHLFLLFSFFIMVAGFGAYFRQELGISSFIGVFIILTLCYFTFRKNMGGIAKINTFLIPMLTLFVIWMGIQAFCMLPTNMSTSNFLYHSSSNWFISSLLYSSYNSILLVPILLSLKPLLTSKKQIKKVSILTGFILLFLSLSIYITLLGIDIDINFIELPTVYFANKLGVLQKYGYGFIILVAIFTSAISAGFSFLNSFSDTKIRSSILWSMCIGAAFLSYFSFSNLVNFLYPVFGYLGIMQISLLLLKKSAKTDINDIRKSSPYKRKISKQQLPPIM